MGSIFTKDEDKDVMSDYLKNQSPVILENGVIIPPLNTDIRFSEHFPLYTEESELSSQKNIADPSPEVFLIT